MKFIKSAQEMAKEAAAESLNNHLAGWNHFSPAGELERFDASNEAPEEYAHYMANKAVEFWNPVPEMTTVFTEDSPF